MTFEEFLMWAQVDGINAIVGFLWSFVVVRWAWYNSKDEWTQTFIILVASLLVPVVAAATSVAMRYQAFDFEVTFWPALRAGFIAFTVSKGTIATKVKGRQKIAQMKFNANVRKSL
jgi:hypothetical protein